MSAAPPHLSRRPWWMTALAAFCLATLGVLVARDLFVADVRNVEVWLGFEVRGTAALLTAPIHWAIFLVAAWAFWRGRPCIVPAAAAYSFYVALSHLIWSGVSPHGHGWPAGLVVAVVLSVPGFLLLRAHRLTTGIGPTATVGETSAHRASVGVRE